MSKRSIVIMTTTITLAAAVIVAGLWVTGGDPLSGIQELVAPRSTMSMEDVFNGFRGQPPAGQVALKNSVSCFGVAV
ncbi:hypothetical protein JF66_07500 [Cryobacterium sp. MLB-32]|nr:hypothetical protein JF66_07500 [Cryobacterium sp. MLB-32]